MIRALLDRLLKRGPCFEVRQDSARRWYVRKVSSNGQIEEHTQPYRSGKSGAKRAAKRRAEQTSNATWKVVD